MISDNLKKIKTVEIIQLIVYAATLTGFFLALQFFTRTVSLKAEITGQEVAVDPTLLKEYYVENGFNVPNIIRQYFPTEKFYKEKLDDENSLSSDPKSIIYHIKLKEPNENNDLVSFLKEATPMLENQVFEKNGTSISIYTSELGYDIKELKEKTHKMKQQLSPEDFYIWLTALQRSKKIITSLSILNEGTLEAKDILIRIPSPTSTVTGTKENNILSVRDVLRTPSHTITDKLESWIEILQLKPKHQVVLEITTRECPIRLDEIYLTFKEKNVIDVGSAINWGSLMFVYLIILFLSLKAIGLE